MEHEHQHLGAMGALIEEPLEQLLENTGLSHEWTHFVTHTVVDYLEIVLLLFLVVSIISYIQTHIPYDRMKHKLRSLRGIPGYLLALGLGMLSPFCSCSIIPIMMGFLVSGVPLPFCLVFLTSASCLNLTALTAIWAKFSTPFAALYTAFCILICILNAVLISRINSDSLIRMDKLRAEHHHHHDENTVGSRLYKAVCSAWLTFCNVWFFLLLGVVISTAISVFVPQEWIEAALTDNPFALPLATLIGGALHSDVFSIMPVVQTLNTASPAVALTFLMSTMLFSVAEWALLSQAFRTKLIARYCITLLSLALVSGAISILIL